MPVIQPFTQIQQFHIGLSRTTKEIKLEYDDARKHQYVLPVLEKKSDATVVICGSVTEINGKPYLDIWDIREVTHRKGVITWR